MSRYNDKIITIRFNSYELKILEEVVKKRSKYYGDTTSSIIKDIIKEEYKRQKLG